MKYEIKQLNNVISRPNWLESEIGIVRLGPVPVSKSSHPAGASARHGSNNIYSSAGHYSGFKGIADIEIIQ